MTDQLILDDGPITVTEGVDAQGRRTAHITFGVKPNHYPKPGPIGNTTGIILPQTQPALGDDEAPEAEPETEEESAWDAFVSGLKEGAQYYKDNVSEALHDFGGNAMDVGGDVAKAGMATTASGGLLVLSGVGAAPGAVLGTVGGATTVVGGVVSGVGALAESAATVLDSAADAVVNGAVPNVIDPAIGLGTTLLERLLLKKIPGLGGRAPSRGGRGGSGAVVLGVGETTDCGIKPYKDQKCPEGQEAHHIIPDYTLRYGNRRDGSKGKNRIPGMPSQDDGPSICLSGKAKVEGSEHNQAHQGTDPRIKAAGERTDNGVQGTAPIGDIIEMSIEEVSKVKPQCAEEIKSKVDDAFKDVDRSKYGRTTQDVPKKGSESRAVLERGDSHGTTRTTRRR